MTDHDRAEHLIDGLSHIESLVVQLSTAMNEAVSDLDALNKSQGAARVAGALSGDALFGLVRGRCHALGLEPLLQRTTHKTDPNWIAATVARLRRVVG